MKTTIVSRPSPLPQEWGRCKQECSRQRIAGSLRTLYARMLQAFQRDSLTKHICVARPCPQTSAWRGANMSMVRIAEHLDHISRLNPVEPSL